MDSIWKTHTYNEINYTNFLTFFPDPFKAKIFKRTEKKRRNAYLKQLLAPKSALSILQELCPQLKISVSEMQSGNQSQYATKVEVPKWFPHYGHSDQHSQVLRLRLLLY